MTSITTIKPVEILEGDVLVTDDGTGWTATENARIVGGEVRCDVRFIDGGLSTRVWDAGASVTFAVERKGA